MSSNSSKGYLGRRIRRWSIPLQRRYVELIVKHGRPLRSRISITAIELDELDYLSKARKRLGYPMSARERKSSKRLSVWLRRQFASMIVPIPVRRNKRKP